MPGTTPRGYPYPLYSDPMDPAQDLQDLATAVDTDMDALWDRLIAGYNQPGVYLRGTGNQAVANNTDVTATYTAEVYDNGNMANLAVSTTNVNIVQTGIHIAMGRVSWAANGAALAGARQISLVSSGALGVLARRSVNADTGVIAPAGTTATAIVMSFYAVSGTTVTMVQRQNSGAVIQSATRSLAVARIGGL